MSLLVKSATAAALAMTTLSFGGTASAAPLSASLALRDAVTPTAQSVQWGGGYYGGGYGGYGDVGYGGYGGYGGYVNNYDCCCPPVYGYSPSTYYGNYGSGYYDGGYGYRPYPQPYRYARPVYRGYRGY
jgi:hypothetical protein